MKINRRSFFGSALALGAGGMGFAYGENKSEITVSRPFVFDHNTLIIGCPGLSKPFGITLIADSHYTLIDSRDDDNREFASRLSQWPARENDLDLALQSARQRNAERILLLGDIISFPSLANVEFVQRKMDTCGMKWAYIAGNHDWHFEGTPGSDEEHRNNGFKRLKPLYLGANPLMSAFSVGGIRFVLIDNSTYHISEEQLNFFQKELTRGEPVCLCMHIPFYQSLRPILDTLGNPQWGATTDKNWKIERRERWAETGQGAASFEFRRMALSSSSVIAIFAGHEHYLQISTNNGVPQFIIPKNHEGGNHLSVDFCPIKNV